MGEHYSPILPDILRKRIHALGYPSIRRFHADRPALKISYEMFRQVVQSGRVPRSETMLRILQAMRFPPQQVQRVMGLLYPGFGTATPVPEEPDVEQGAEPAGAQEEPLRPVPSPDPSPLKGPERLSLPSPEEAASRLYHVLPKISLEGNEDFWEIVNGLAEMAERKLLSRARTPAGQPLLFEREPEAIYHFLVRRTRVTAYMSRGENTVLAFGEDIDYRDRFRGALLGAAAGEALGGPAQGLSERDIRELYGRIETLRKPAAGSSPAPSPLLELSRTLAEEGRMSPEKIGSVLARHPSPPRGRSDEIFARNLGERGFPWFEAGVAAPESTPAVRIPPLALLRAGDFRKLKLEAGIFAAVTHPHPGAVAGAIVQASAVARLLHAPPGPLEPLPFVRSLGLLLHGPDTDRPPRARGIPTLSRRLGTELPALLLRQADVAEIRKALGNGIAVSEGVPFALACFLLSPGDFRATVLAAVHAGNDAEGVASMAGALAGAFLGISGIPEDLLRDLPGRDALTEAADALLALARGAEA